MEWGEKKMCEEGKRIFSNVLGKIFIQCFVVTTEAFWISNKLMFQSFQTCAFFVCVRKSIIQSSIIRMMHFCLFLELQHTHQLLYIVKSFNMETDEASAKIFVLSKRKMLVSWQLLSLVCLLMSLLYSAVAAGLYIYSSCRGQRSL